ncbi:MAG: hypothetical protein C4532_05105 [Candidatus Abyssobacteria bacterium SURF_17]|uniref:Uncharacterized protein n=1 Tax=Candidatus Abyssobacteria bacterium SURF_17 TaxID=2093361 RepID=A0A419F346_9BACT|nr:MAG: hypothetical protein C4532_05105 [Candidatus Abyssubacteria bacterium SURF_17]
MQWAPFLPTVPFEAGPSPNRTSQVTSFLRLSILAEIKVSLPFFVASENERTRGICALQAGLGHLTVRAQSQMTTRSPFGPLG